jgi:TPR repeat protein
MIGSYYDEGKGAVTKDACQAIEWYRRAAEQDHVNAILKMGICYMQGKYLVTRSQLNFFLSEEYFLYVCTVCKSSMY